MLQEEVYERARLARDSRFDGQFYIGVKTTGIYCRPICPANSPKSENVSFTRAPRLPGKPVFDRVCAAALNAHPGTPAWSGTSTTVRRGLRLISSGALDDGNVESSRRSTGRHQSAFAQVIHQASWRVAARRCAYAETAFCETPDR